MPEGIHEERRRAGHPQGQPRPQATVSPQLAEVAAKVGGEDSRHVHGHDGEQDRVFDSVNVGPDDTQDRKDERRPGSPPTHLVQQDDGHHEEQVGEEMRSRVQRSGNVQRQHHEPEGQRLGEGATCRAGDPPDEEVRGGDHEETTQDEDARPAQVPVAPEEQALERPVVVRPVAAGDRERERLVIEQCAVLEHPAPAGKVIEGVAFAAAEAEEAERKEEGIQQDEGQPDRRAGRVRFRIRATDTIRCLLFLSNRRARHARPGIDIQFHFTGAIGASHSTCART